jgi:hypothetical protein
MNLSRWIESVNFPDEGDIAMVRERLHYENLKSLTDKQLDVIRYLYMRLNIIDGKAGYLLRINTLTASVISVLVSFGGKGDGSSIFSSISEFQTLLLVFALIFITAAFVLSFAIGELEYDRVTEPPVFFNQVRIEGYSNTQHPNTLPSPPDRRFLGNYSSDEARSIIEIVQQSGARLAAHGERVHSLKKYEDLFFKITIARVKLLRTARNSVGMAVIFSLAVVVSFAIFPPKGPTKPAAGRSAAVSGIILPVRSQHS